MLSTYREAVAQNLIIDDEIRKLITREGRDFRVCTSCSGPLLIPTDVMPSKSSDIQIEIGDNSLFVSMNIIRYTRRIHRSLLDQYHWVMENSIQCDPD